MKITKLQVRASGAEAELVRFSATQLDSTVDRLNASERGAAEAVTGWGVDTTSNRVTVSVLKGRQHLGDLLLPGPAGAVRDRDLLGPRLTLPPQPRTIERTKGGPSASSALGPPFVSCTAGAVV